MRIPVLSLKRRQWEPLAFTSPSRRRGSSISSRIRSSRPPTNTSVSSRSRSPRRTEALAKRKSPKDALDNAVKEWDKVTERRGPDKQKAAWGEKLAEMKQLGIEYHPEWAGKGK